MHVVHVPSARPSWPVHPPLPSLAPGSGPGAGEQKQLLNWVFHYSLWEGVCMTLLRTRNHELTKTNSANVLQNQQQKGHRLTRDGVNVYSKP